MNHDIDFKVGDLVYIINDCYIFMKERAKITKMGGFGIIISISPPEEYENNNLMVKFWEESIKVEVSGGISGWILKENLVLVCD
jgi:hypothetical protein